MGPLVQWCPVKDVLMRMLLSTIGSRGDVQPLVALAMALKALGQDVRFCVPPDFREWIEGLGMPVTPIGPELRRAPPASPPAPAAPLTAERRLQLAESLVATQFDTIVSAAHGCDIIVAATALQMGARSVAEKLGIPYVFVAYCPNVLPSPHHAPPPLPPIPGLTPPPPSAGNRELWLRDADRFNTLFGPALNAHRATLGLAAVDDVRGHVLTDRPWLAADPTLGPAPDAADGSVFQTGAWIQPDDRPLAPEITAFLDSGEPPVYFGFGSMRAPQDLGQVMLGAARALGRRAIVSRGWAGLSLDGAADCLAIDEVNQQALFGRVAAVVHHGGAGTTSIAALASAPQVVVPQIYDQHYWAERVDALGIGLAHEAGTPSSDSLAGSLERALKPAVADQARAVGRLIRRDGARVAAEQLLLMA